MFRIFESGDGEGGGRDGEKIKVARRGRDIEGITVLKTRTCNPLTDARTRGKYF
jgi:hypothetical protein